MNTSANISCWMDSNMSKINCRMNEFCYSFQYHCRPFVDIHYFVYKIIALYSIAGNLINIYIQLPTTAMPQTSI